MNNNIFKIDYNEALNNLAVYSATHNGILDTSVDAVGKCVEAINILRNKPHALFRIKDYDTYPDYYADYKFDMYLLSENEFYLLKGVFYNDSTRSMDAH